MVKLKFQSKFTHLHKVVVLLALLVIGILSYHFMSSNSLPPQPVIQQQNAKQTDTAAKQKFIENNTQPSSPNDDPILDNIKISASQTSDSVIVTAELYKYSSGNCYIFIKNDDKSFTQTVSILYQPTFSTCTGFSIPKNNLGAGIWSISLSVTEGATTLTKSTSLEVK